MDSFTIGKYHLPLSEEEVKAIPLEEWEASELTQEQQVILAIYHKRPLLSKPPKTEQEITAVKAAKIYEQMSKTRRNGKYVKYVWFHNPSASRYWNSFLKTAYICLYNELDPEEFVAAQFYCLAPEHCSTNWRTKCPPPNILHSEGAMKRYIRYFVETQGGVLA